MKIFPKFLLTFLVLLLLPISFISFYFISQIKQVKIEEILQSLDEIAESRIHYIEEYFKNNEKITSILARTEDLTQSFDQLGQNGQLPIFEPLLILYSTLFKIENCYLVNREGQVVYSLREKERSINLHDNEYKESELARIFKIVSSSLDSSLSRFDYFGNTANPVVFIGAPIFNKGTFVGMLAIRIPPRQIYTIFNDYTSLGETGEVLIGEKKGNYVVFLNPIRHDRAAAFNRKVRINDNIALPVQFATQGNSGRGVSIDYRSKPIIAVWKYFPKMNWGIVVKIDKEEALKHITKMTYQLWLLTGFLFFVITVIVYIFVYLLFRPLYKLNIAAQEISKGNLDIELISTSTIEIGDFTKNFVEMVKFLRSSMTSIDRLNIEIAKREATERQRDEYISRISHELRTPMMPLIDSIAMLKTQCQFDHSTEASTLLSLIEQNSNRLLSLINTIIHYQSLTLEHTAYEKKECDINALLQDVILTQTPFASKKSLIIATDYCPTLPAIILNKDLIKELFTEVIYNAIKYTDRGNIHVTTSIDDKSILITITDTGIGISKEDLNKIFVPFGEYKTKSPIKKQGYGINLAICKAIVDMCKGTLSYESTVGRGTKVLITLPKKDINE